MALAEMDGTLKKTPKSVLLRKLEGMGQTVEAFPTDYVLIIDRMAAVRQFKVASLTYKNFAGQLLRYFIALGKNASKMMQYLMSIIRIQSRILKGTDGVKEN